MESSLDISLLHQAVRLAMNGRGRVEPNPMVGCIIARGERVIGHGWHQKFGDAHAEPNALASCMESPLGATAYLTLEPCCHTKKKTPPCVPALIAAGLGRIVVGCEDPNPQVSGQGLAQLKAAGIKIELANNPRCRQLLTPFIARIVHQRPYITLKWAQSSDGKIAGPGGRRVQISNPRSLHAIHELRSRCDAILVGVGTVLADDPLLTARGVRRFRPLLRIVLDSDLRLPLASRLVETIDQGRVILFCSKEAAEYSGTRATLAARGVEIHAVSSPSPGRLDLRQIIDAIARLEVTHLMIEPGPTLAQSLFAADLWDRAWVSRSPTPIGCETSPSAPTLPPGAIRVAEIDLDGHRLAEYLNPHGVYAGPFPSADLELEFAGA